MTNLSSSMLSTIKNLYSNKCIQRSSLPHELINYLLTLEFIKFKNDSVCGSFSDNMKLLENDVLLRNLGFQFIKYFYSIDSTMSHAKKIADNYSKAIIFSEVQTKGRGRARRIWLSPPGGIWLSILWQIERKELLEILSLAIGVAVVNALKKLLLIDFKLKWPNDIMFSVKKIGGILIENMFKDDKVLSIIGIGLNVNNKMRFSGLQGVISLSEILGFNMPRNVILKAIALEVARILEKTGVEDIIDLWRKMNLTIGKKIAVKINHLVVEGIVLDISPRGKLIIEDSKGKVWEISYGDVVYLEGIEYRPIL
ncbi:MAG: biotin--[acetyl-CoA-carboxylase] ligase [Thermoprotei archaeon]|nr:MAG: biotin--[acetyl-CoA-carboxylase] ligase [Thermoprotei archaeon]